MISHSVERAGLRPADQGGFVIGWVADFRPNPYFKFGRSFPKRGQPNIAGSTLGFSSKAIRRRLSSFGAQSMTVSHPPYSAQVVLDFWFGPEDAPEYGKPRPEWFSKDPSFDAEVTRRFAGLHGAAAQGMLDYFWKDAPMANLALVIVLDQFSRQIYRGDAKAFARDAHALTMAKHAIEAGFDRDALPVHRLFWYLPFEHSENLQDQDRSVELIRPLGNAEWTRYAEEHRAVIARFGRFPHRNIALGRESTPEEEAYLAQAGAGF